MRSLPRQESAPTPGLGTYAHASTKHACMRMYQYIIDRYQYNTTNEQSTTMSIGMNRVFLMGYIGNDPELRQAGSALVMNLRVATTSRYRDRNDEYQERTDWHNVTVWGRRAENLAVMVGKGDLVVVEGALRTHSYEKDGIKRYVTDVRASDIRFLGKRQHDPGASHSAQQVALGQMAHSDAPVTLPVKPKQRRRRQPEQRAAA